MLKVFLSTLILISSVSAIEVKIHGIVTDGTTDKPIEWAQIEVVGTEYGATADYNGEYYVLNVPPGKYQVTASCVDYKKVTKEVIVTSDRIAELDFALEPAPPDTTSYGPIITYLPADTTLPEKYIKQDLFELNWGSGPGEIGKMDLPPGGYAPSGLAVDDSGYIYILDIANKRIAKFDSTGRFISNTEIRYARQTMYMIGLGVGRRLDLTYLGFDKYGNFLIAANDDFLYTFGRDGNYLRRDTTEYEGVNFVGKEGKAPVSIKIEHETLDAGVVTIKVDNLKTKEMIKELRIKPKKWVMRRRHPDFYISNIDENGNSYIIVVADSSKLGDDKHGIEYIIYVMLEKYDKKGHLLTQIPLGVIAGDRTRPYVTSEGEIYTLDYNDFTDKSPIISKWVLDKTKGQR